MSEHRFCDTRDRANEMEIARLERRIAGLEEFIQTILDGNLDLEQLRVEAKKLFSPKEK